jgi:hypothetical protein
LAWCLQFLFFVKTEVSQWHLLKKTPRGIEMLKLISMLAIAMSCSVNVLASDVKLSVMSTASNLKQESEIAAVENEENQSGVEKMGAESKKSLLMEFATDSSVRLNYRRPYSSDVYCAFYAEGNVQGYSLYREYDRRDIGNAIWKAGSSTYECDEAAELANYVRQDIVCGRYAQNGKASYSIYRIHDNQDLGKATMSSFDTCQQVVRSARHGLFCSTYIHNGQTWWSVYDIRTGNDLGSKVYASFETCLSVL